MRCTEWLTFAGTQHHHQMNRPVKTYLVGMVLFWGVFGLITTFMPSLMDLFQTPEGIAAKTAFSDHVWRHDGLDILALCIVLFALSGTAVNARVLRAVALAALLPTIGIFHSLATTVWWNPLFIGAGLGCFAFVVWGFVLARKSAA